MNISKSAILNSGISAGIFFVAAITIYIGFYYVVPQPFIRELPIEVRTKIQTINDIEKLRAVALKFDSNARSNAIVFNSLFRESVILIIIFSLASCFLFLVNIAFWVRFLREEKNENISWWLMALTWRSRGTPQKRGAP